MKRRNILIYGTPILITFLLLFSCKNYTEVKFNSKQWISDKIGHKNIRVKKVNNLINSNLLLDMEVDSVFKLLGDECYFQSPKTENKIAITVKESYGLNIDPLYTQYLIATFDKETNKIVTVEFQKSNDRRSFIEKIFMD